MCVSKLSVSSTVGLYAGIYICLLYVCLTKYVHVYIYEQNNQHFILHMCVCGQDVAGLRFTEMRLMITRHIMWPRTSVKHKLNHPATARRQTAVKLKIYGRCNKIRTAP